jgi:hypothetical protein
MPWLGSVILGAYFVAAKLGASVPDVPMTARLLVAAVAFAPLIIGAIASIAGPIPGLAWMFRLPTPKLLVNDTGVRLLPGRSDEPEWSLDWGEIQGLRSRGFPAHIEIDSARGTVVLPSSLSVGRVEGTGAIVRVWDLLEAWTALPGFR